MVEVISRSHLGNHRIDQIQIELIDLYIHVPTSMDMLQRRKKRTWFGVKTELQWLARNNFYYGCYELGEVVISNESTIKKQYD